MKRRLFLALVVAALCGPPLVHAFIPINIENAIRGWFNSAGKLVGFTAKGTIIAGSFDSPASPTVGGCVTIKEGSNNGTSTVQDCAPSDLAANRVNTRNTDGTIKSSDIATALSQDYGRTMRFNYTTGAVEQILSSTFAFLPDGTTSADGNPAGTSILSGTNMRCVEFVARETVVGATSIQAYVAAAGGNCSLCLYAAGTGGALIAPLTSGSPGAAKVCTGTGMKVHTADAFNMFTGVKYRLCYTTDSSATRWVAAAGYDNVYVNGGGASPVVAGLDSSVISGGVCPSVSGSLSAGDGFPSIVKIY